jgi:hypothetical protein
MVSLRAEGMAARDVVPQPPEPRSFRRRRTSDEARPAPSAVPVEVKSEPVDDAPVATPAAVPVIAAPVTAPMQAPVSVDVELPAAPFAESSSGAETDELFRAQTTLLRAALRQTEELANALREEQGLRRQEHERLTAENQLLRDALAALHTEALERQETVVAAPTVEVVAPRVPEQRDDVPRTGRRRSARGPGPA